eukprot:m.1480 g.1480  ORF g.1480 m.1480 type:complete len:103 (+) comp1360_c0_seq1:29-337(+)
MEITAGYNLKRYGFGVADVDGEGEEEGDQQSTNQCDTTITTRKTNKWKSQPTNLMIVITVTVVVITVVVSNETITPLFSFRQQLIQPTSIHPITIITHFKSV